MEADRAPSTRSRLEPADREPSRADAPEGRPSGSRRRLAPLLVALAVASSACASRWEPAFDETAAPGALADVAIADPDEALTFARVEEGGGKRVIAVTGYRDGEVVGVDLGRALGRQVGDPVRVFDEVGYEGLLERIRSPSPGDLVRVPASELVMPVDLRAHHVAAATNFPEHAADAGSETPFLFAKLVAPTGPYEPVSAGEGLLDYEVELGWVPLAPLRKGDEPAFMGLVLCNDFTDRDTLLRAIDPWDVESGKGFTTGKSFPGYLPIGNLFVMPRDHRRFAAESELRLYVDGALRQRSPASAMIWDFDELIARTWTWQDRRWDHRGTQVSLLPGSDVIPERTLILSGTPHGTVFAGLQAPHFVSGIAAWLLGGWSDGLPSHVVSAYIDDARSAGAYLRPGNRVEIHADRLGVLQNPIVD